MEMSSIIPEDVHREIAKAIMAFSIGKSGEEREELRKLRDLTLLNLSLTSQQVSSVTLPALYRNITVTPFNSRLFVPNPRIGPSPCINTRFLRLGILKPKKLTREMNERMSNNEEEANHPALEELQKREMAHDEECSKVLDIPYPDALKKDLGVLTKSRSASILSLIIDSMPHLQLLELCNWAYFYFAKLDVVPESGVRFSRPLSGLLNLRILKMGRSILVEEIDATNCIWLMLFLPSLTHLKAYVEFRLSDKKFFRDHQEVFNGKSKVTHLELEFAIKNEDRRLWIEPRTTETDILEKLLRATGGLVELKLRNSSLSTKNPPAPMATSLLFLRSLKTSTDSLKYLSLIGQFTEHTVGSEAEDRRRNPPVSINLKSLEMISFDCLSIQPLMRPEEDSRIRLDFPSLETSRFPAISDWKQHPYYVSSAVVVKWIKCQSFPTSVKRLLLDEEPLNLDGNVIENDEEKVEWEKERAELLNLCREKGIEVKILKEDEQLPFGVMPEPEDLV